MATAGGSSRSDLPETIFFCSSLSIPSGQNSLTPPLRHRQSATVGQDNVILVNVSAAAGTWFLRLSGSFAWDAPGTVTVTYAVSTARALHFERLISFSVSHFVNSEIAHRRGDLTFIAAIAVLRHSLMASEPDVLFL